MKQTMRLNLSSVNPTGWWMTGTLCREKLKVVEARSRCGAVQSRAGYDAWENHPIFAHRKSAVLALIIL